MTKKVVVTGGAGWIGGWVVRELVERGYQVVVVDQKQPGEQQRVPGVRYRTGDHERLGDLVEVFHGATAAIHLSAIAAPGRYPNDYVFRTNTLGTYSAAEAAIICGLRALAAASSINVLGFGYRTHDFAPDYLPVDENHRLHAQDPYSLSKICDEQTLAMAHRRTGGALRTVAIRPSGVMRPWQYKDVAERLGREPTTGGRSLFTYTDPRDLAILFRLAIESEHPEAACVAVFANQVDSLAAAPLREVFPRAYPGTEHLPGLDCMTGTEAGVTCALANRLFGWQNVRSWRNPADHLPPPAA